MGKLKKKIFTDKKYQFGYNDAMQIALDNERELKEQIYRLECALSKCGHCGVAGGEHDVTCVNYDS